MKYDDVMYTCGHMGKPLPHLDGDRLLKHIEWMKRAQCPECYQGIREAREAKRLAELTEGYFDFHGYYPDEAAAIVCDVVLQAWEMGFDTLRLIHGHGYDRPAPRPFANTNTGELGMAIRRELRDKALRPWMYAKFDISHMGSTTVRLKPNPQPSRTKLDFNVGEE